MKKLLFIIMASASVFACRKGDMESVPVQITDPYYTPRHHDFIEFKATLQSYPTKAVLDIADTRKVTWEKGDKVLVCDGDKEALYEALSGGKDTTTLVRVSGDTLSAEGGKIFTAWYPADYKSKGVQSRYSYNNPSVLGSVPMTASGSRNFNFENACAVVKCYYKPESTLVVKNIRFSSGVSLTDDGDVVMDCTEVSPVGYTFYKGRVSTFSLYLAPGVYPGFKVNMTGTDVSKEITLEYDLELQKNTVAEVDLNMPEGKTVNLTKSETANCYVIYNPGEYLFVPTRGCSEEPIEGIDKVEVLWEMDNQDSAPASSIISSLRYSSGKIIFTTPEKFKTGNALIAAKDSDGKILWSWHIWACEDGLSYIGYDSAGKYCLMDRSLGALASGVKKPNDNKYASSLLYQWGRKDPFPGQTTQGSRNLIKVSGTARTTAAGPVDIVTSIANPTVFYKDDADWCSAPSDSYWNSSDKSIYDPCPAGYIIPPKNVFTEEADVFYNGYMKLAKSTSGSFTFSSGGDVFCYPLSGFFKGTDGSRDGKATVYAWTSDCSDTQAVSCYMYYSKTETHPVSGQLTFIKPDTAMPRSAGISVRCMKIIEK